VLAAAAAEAKRRTKKFIKHLHKTTFRQNETQNTIPNRYMKPFLSPHSDCFLYFVSFLLPLAATAAAAEYKRE